MTIETVNLLTKDEVKNIDNVTWNKNTASHVNKLIRIATGLTAEIDRYKALAKLIPADVLAKLTTVDVETRERPQFSKDDFIAVYGEEEYKRFLRNVPAKYVSFNG